MMTERVYLLLGSNEGDREQLLRQALAALSRHTAGPLVTSSIYETAAWGKEDQPPFLNLALGFDTELSPEALLRATRAIEAAFGRQRAVVWGQRTLDIDILFYGDRIIDMPGLTVPHPRLQERRFALAPLAEIAAGLVHPALNKTVEELLDECPDPLPVAVLR